MGPGFESQRDHRETVKPLDYQGVFFFNVVDLTKNRSSLKGSSQKVGDKHLILDKWKRKHQNFRNISH